MLENNTLHAHKNLSAMMRLKSRVLQIDKMSKLNLINNERTTANNGKQDITKK